MFTETGEWIPDYPIVGKDDIKKQRAAHRAKFAFLQENADKNGTHN